MATHRSRTGLPADACDAQAGRALVRDAAILARRRRHDEARLLLEEAVRSGGCSEREALDLRARMSAQQGLLLEAEALWTRAAELAGDPRAYAPQLARLRGRARAPGVGAALLLAGLAILVALGGWLWRWGGPHGHGRDAGVATAAPPSTLPSTAPAELAAPRDEASEARREREATVERLVALIGQLRADVSALAGADAERTAAARDQAQLFGRLQEAVQELNQGVRARAEQDASAAAHAAQAMRALVERVAGCQAALQALEGRVAAWVQGALAEPPAGSDALPRLLDEGAARIAALEVEVRELTRAIESMVARASASTPAPPLPPPAGEGEAPSTAPPAAPQGPPARGAGSGPCAPRTWPR